MTELQRLKEERKRRDALTKLLGHLRRAEGRVTSNAGGCYLAHYSDQLRTLRARAENELADAKGFIRTLERGGGPGRRTGRRQRSA